jgi:glycerophosphoryl diester phosphodiesterase
LLSLERRDGRPLCVGHRGAAALAPENTLRSFRAGVEAGADLIEFDVLGLASGELVVAHSYDLHEVTHGAAEGSFRALSLDDVRVIAPDLPTLDEALAFFVDEAPVTGVHVDLKDGGAAEGLLAALRRFRVVERTIVSSFHRAAIRGLARTEPALRTGVSFPEDRLRISHRPGSTPVIRVGLHTVRPVMPVLGRTLLARSGASALALHHSLVGPRLMRWARARGVPVIAWTVNDPRDLVRLDGVGVDAVVVNSPAMFVSTLAA